MAGFAKYWPEVMRRARRKSPIDRAGALSTAVTLLELSLPALGIKKDRAGGLRGAVAAFLSDRVGGVAFDDVAFRAAVHARNLAIHEHTVPAAGSVRRHVQAVYRAWISLRREYVTRENAAEVAQALLTANFGTDVYLFGSLAREARGAGDIDLLVYDEGSLSYLGSEYGEETSGLQSVVLQDALGAAESAALRCGWLDIVVVDGRRFGADRAYTLGVAERHHDKLFFVNISRDLRRYNKETMDWTAERPTLFTRLESIRLFW